MVARGKVGEKTQTYNEVQYIPLDALVIAGSDEDECKRPGRYH